MLSQTEIYELVNDINDKHSLSGVVLVKERNNIMYEGAYGYANRADGIVNNIETRFSTASGGKLLTAIGICQLVEKGLFSFDTRLKDCLNITFPNFDESITIHQLLTHTSGVPDYFNEHMLEEKEELWKDRPMYLITSLKDYLPLFQFRTMVSLPGEKFYYNNAGYILLGLILEEQSGLTYREYVESRILGPIGMECSGYFYLNQLPVNTSYGYIDDEASGTWRTNIYSIPIVGASDGGLYVTAKDMVKLWEALLNYRLLSRELTHILFTPHMQYESNEYYGYGVRITKKDEIVYKYHVNGSAPGVNFRSSVYPALDLKIVTTGNQHTGPQAVTESIEKKMSKMWWIYLSERNN